MAYWIRKAEKVVGPLSREDVEARLRSRDLGSLDEVSTDRKEWIKFWKSEFWKRPQPVAREPESRPRKAGGFVHPRSRLSPERLRATTPPEATRDYSVFLEPESPVEPTIEPPPIPEDRWDSGTFSTQNEQTYMSADESRPVPQENGFSSPGSDVSSQGGGNYLLAGMAAVVVFGIVFALVYWLVSETGAKMNRGIALAPFLSAGAVWKALRRGGK